MDAQWLMARAGRRSRSNAVDQQGMEIAISAFERINEEVDITWSARDQRAPMWTNSPPRAAVAALGLWVCRSLGCQRGTHRGRKIRLSIPLAAAYTDYFPT
jgi:hypothetical protein